MPTLATSPYYYTAFGLTIGSDFILPDYSPLEPMGPVDVQIRVAKITTGIETPTARGVLWKACPGQIEFNLPNKGSIWIQDGRRIIVDPVDGVDVSQLQITLLGSVMGALLQQRGFLTLHASAFRYRDHAVLICGKSGAGKSTLLQGFLQRGYSSLVDDVTPVRIIPNSPPTMQSAFPSGRLCPDALEFLGIEQSQLRNRGAKSVIKLTGFESKMLPIKHIFVLGTHRSTELKITPLSAAEILKSLTLTTYRRHYLEGMGLRKEHFLALSAISRWGRVTRVSRHQGFEYFETMLDQMESLICAPNESL